MANVTFNVRAQMRDQYNFFRLFGLNKNPQQGVPLDAPQVPVMGEGGGDDGKQVC